MPFPIVPAPMTPRVRITVTLSSVYRLLLRLRAVALALRVLRLRAVALALRVLRLRAVALALRVLRLRAVALALRRRPLYYWPVPPRFYLSTAKATALPPPRHKVAIPRFALRRFIS